MKMNHSKNNIFNVELHYFLHLLFLFTFQNVHLFILKSSSKKPDSRRLKLETPFRTIQSPLDQSVSEKSKPLQIIRIGSGTYVRVGPYVQFFIEITVAARNCCCSINLAQFILACENTHCPFLNPEVLHSLVSFLSFQQQFSQTKPKS